MEEINRQINRYFMAVYGKSYTYAAPETFPNVLERWMLAVAANQLEHASDLMTQIEEMAVAAKEERES